MQEKPELQHGLQANYLTNSEHFLVNSKTAVVYD